VAAYVRQYGTDSVAGIVFVDSPVSAGAAEVVIRPQFAQVILSQIAVYAAHPKEFTEGMVGSILLKPHPELDMQAVVTAALRTPTNTGIAMLVTDIFGVDRRPVLSTINKPPVVIASAASPLQRPNGKSPPPWPGRRSSWSRAPDTPCSWTNHNSSMKH